MLSFFFGGGGGGETPPKKNAKEGPPPRQHLSPRPMIAPWPPALAHMAMQKGFGPTTFFEFWHGKKARLMRTEEEEVIVGKMSIRIIGIIYLPNLSDSVGFDPTS